MIYSATIPSPIGELTVASDGEHLIGLWLMGQKYFLSSLTEAPSVCEDLTVFTRTRAWLDRYFAGDRPLPQELPLAPRGSDFRQAVWQCLLDIPYGETTTYATIAKRIAPMLGRASMSAQAVGGAVGHNPISIIIPCHRVLGADGSLTGYAGGLDVKTRLLTHEGIQLTAP